MTEENSQKWQKYLKLYAELGQKLQKNGWLADGWQYDVREQPEFDNISCQLARANWYNQQRNGIHFDCGLGERQLAAGTVAIMLHCHQDFPTPQKFCRLVAARIAPIAQDWESSSINPDHPLQPFVLKLTFNDDNLVNQLEQGFYQVRQLLPVIDATIADVLAG